MSFSTSFPALDTLYRPPLAAGQAGISNGLGGTAELHHDNKPADFAWNKATLARGSVALTADTVLEAGARLIAAFTGEDDVVFHYSLPPAVSSSVEQAPERFGIATAVVEYDAAERARSCTITTYPGPQHSYGDAQTDFAVDVLENGQTATFSTKPFVLRVELGSKIQLSIHYYRQLMSPTIGQSMLNFVIDYLTSSSYTAPPKDKQAAIWSKLNYPCLSQPPRLLEDQNHGHYDIGPALLHSAFRRRAKDHPNRPALDFLVSISPVSPAVHDIYTYSELDRLTDALAACIRSKIPASDKQSVIPAIISSSAELYVCWLATIKSGCAFCPVSPEAPADQLLYVFQDVEASLLLGRGPKEGALSGALDDAFTWVDATAFIDEWRSTGRKSADATILPPIDENDLAYVMYTSGSTGRPKGVKITHHAAACSVASHSLYLSSRSTSIPARWFQFAAPTFDPSVMEIFVTFSTGSTLCSAERQTSLTDPETTITELRATVMMATPSMAAILNPHKVPTLKDLWVMGEAVNRRVIDNFSTDSPTRIERHGNSTAISPEGLLNAYGPTEGSINCTVVSNFSVHDRGSIIGKPLPTCAMFVIDAAEKDAVVMPLGFPGELVIGGPQVSAGYLNRPEETAKAFLESEEYGRLYRTGDRARVVQDRDGSLTIEYLGRLTTDQVKLSGRRVELGDIEAVVEKVDGVREAVVVAHKPFGGGHGSEQVVACILPHADAVQELLVKSCQAAADKWLQPHMRPSKYFFFGDIPRSRSGKIDRRSMGKLVEERWSTVAAPATTDRPMSEDIVLDEAVKQLVFTGVADVTDISADDISSSAELLSYGFDSLRAMRFLQRARELGLQRLTVGDVVTCRTFKDLVVKHMKTPELGQEVSSSDISPDAWNTAAAAFQHKHEEECARSLDVPTEVFEKILPTTSTQSGMLASFLRSLIDPAEQGVKHYINHSVYEVPSGHDLSAVRDAWLEALHNGDAFRMAFVSVDDDLAPFAQCVFKASCPRGQVQATSYRCESDDEFSNLVSRALEEAESSIVLDRPPLSLAIVQSPNRAGVILSLFHAIFDGGSLQLLVQDVEDRFFGLDRHFRADREGAKKYWLKKLEDCAPTTFPALSRLQPRYLSKGPRVSSVLSEITLNDLQSASKASQISSLAVLQAAWSIVLFGYTGAKADVVFGSVVSDRYSQETADCLGPTFVTVPIRVSAHSDVPVKDVTKRLTLQNTEAIQHLHTPLSSLVTSEGRLHYDTLLAFQSFPGGAAGSDLWKSIEYPPMGNDFAVMLEIWPTENGQLLLKATYEHKCLDDVAAHTMLMQLEGAITFILENPNESFLHGRFASGAELLSAFPETAKADTTGEVMLLHGPFEKLAAETPDKLALDFFYGLDSDAKRVKWTFSELNEKADALARHLVAKLGSLADRVVPICMEKCPELYVAILGILKAGAAWCPIHPDFPPKRQHDLIARADASLVILAHSTATIDASAIPEDVEILNIAVPLPDSEMNVAAVLPAPEPQNLAYLIFTSGTTGPPKGVPIGHKAAASAMRALCEVIPSDTRTGTVRGLQFSQYTFDVFVEDLFEIWRMGGTVVSAPKELMLGSFVQLANYSKATHAHLTPAFASAVARDNLETMEVITMIGEKLNQPVADDWGNNMRAYNTYGPAEAAVVSTVEQFGPGGHSQVKSSNVGVPLASVGAYVIQDGRAVMRNAIGELALSGDQLSYGYWKDSDKSNEKFIWCESLQRTVYLTGDLVRQLGDGSIDFVGRDDDLVKIAGQRVELSEIAYFLRASHPAVQQTEILYLESQKRSGRVVVAFLAVPGFGGGEGEDAAIVKVAEDSAGRLLPAHMIPDFFIVLPTIPRTPSAKVDRHALKRIFYDHENTRVKEVVEDVSAVEWREANPVLVDALAQVTGAPKESIKPSSTLAALGIDSIGAIRLAAKMNAAQGSLSVLDVLRCKTISDIGSFTGQKEARLGLAQNMKDFDNTWAAPVAAYLGHGGFKVAPASVLQESLLGESMQNPQSYWSNHFFNLDGSIDLQRLRDAWLQIAQETESLRAGFVPKAALPKPGSAPNVDSIFLQVVYEEARVSWVVQPVEKGNLMETARDVSVQTARRHQDSVFRHPPWAVNILEHGEARTMVVSIHHSLHDGPSLDFIIAELGAKYNAHATKPRCQLLEALAIASTDADLQATEAFWEKELQGISSDISEGPGAKISKDASPAGMRTTDHVSSLSKKELQDATRRLGASSIAAVIRAAWGFSLAEFCESPDMVFAEVLSDRVMDARLETAIAPLISVVPVPFRARGTGKELISEQNRISRDTWDHRHVRPGTVRRILQRPVDQPLYPAVFVFHPDGDAFNAHTQYSWTKAEDLVLNVEHAMAFNVWQVDENITLSFSAANDVMSEQHQTLFVRQVDALLSAMISHPDVEVADLTNFFPDDLKSVTKPRPDTLCPAKVDPTWWVDHFAKEHPDWKAVEIATQIWPEAESVSWTYKELDTYANRVAAYINKYGSGGGSVALCMPRTLEAFGIIYGIFKSGQTYLPLEESLPLDRKMFLCQDSNASLLFTTADLFEVSPEFDDQTCKVVDVETAGFQDELTTFDSKPVPITYDPGANAYVLYTSGSTGKPKGVLVSRQNLASFMDAQSEFICDVVPATKTLGGTGKYLNLASRAFDVHIGEMFLSWRHGLTAITARRTLLLDDLAAALRNLRITHASFVPSLLDQTGLTPDDAPELVFLGVGGEKMTEKTRKLWGGHDRVGLINAYGPTEVTVGCCSGRLWPNSDPKNIGSPLGDSVGHLFRPGTNTYVRRMMPGELCFTGSLVANGYLNRPDAAGFVENFNGERMYRTGDIVRLMPDNSIEFLGRKDDQVKIRGQRVELGEISEGVRVSSSEPVNVATLLLKHEELSRPQLIAFVASEKDIKVAKEKKEECRFLDERFEAMNASVRPNCQKILPAHMVPDLFIPVNVIPLTATSAKADTKLLNTLFSSIPVARLMAGSHKPVGAPAVSNRPCTAEEETIASILKALIADESREIRPDTSIFELGIDSLSAISLFMKLKEVGYECSVANVLTHPTIEQLATLPHKDKQQTGGISLEQIRQQLAQIETDYREDPAPPIPSNLVQAVRPCLPLQEIMVARSADSGDDSNSFYVNHIMLQIAGGVDIEKFCRAWEATVAENEVLRTCFWFSGDHFRQIVLHPDAGKIAWGFARAEDDTPSQTVLSQLYPRIRQDIVQNLSTKPPVRFTFGVSRGGQRTALLISIHHALYDGESLGMLFEEVHKRYHDSAPDPRESPGSLVEYITSRDKESAKKHWSGLLENWQQTRLVASDSIDHNAPVTIKYRTFSASLTSIEAVASRQKLTVAAVLQAAFGTALAQMLGTNDIIFGAVLSGRAVPVKDVNRILAPCITTIPQRVNLSKLGTTLQDVFATFQKLSYESLEYQHSSARDIQVWVGADRPLYDTLFSFARAPEQTIDYDLWEEIESDMPMDSSLAVEVESDYESDKLNMAVGCTAAFGDGVKAEEMLERIEMLVDTVLNGDALPLADLGISVESPSVDATNKKMTTWDEATWSEEEKIIRQLVADFAQVSSDSVSKNTSFLHIGIDSITAIRFARKLREHGYNLSSADVMRNSCVGALCFHFKPETVQATANNRGGRQDSVFEAHQPELEIPASVKLREGDIIEAVYRCTPLQVGMLTQTLGLDGRLYVHHHTLRLSPDVDLAKFKEAWEKSVRQIDVLRTSFHRSGTEWVAVVHENFVPRWREVSTSDMDAALQNLQHTTAFHEESQFNEPPVKVTVFSDGSSVVFSASMHHALYDGMSVPILFQQLTDNYFGKDVNPSAPFHQAAKIMTANQKAAIDFWSNKLGGYRSISIPLTEEETRSKRMTLASIDITDISRPREKSFSVQNITLLAFAKALSSLVQRRDVAFGMVLAGRSLELENADTIIGPTFNTVPYRIRLANPLSSNEILLQQLQQLTIDGIEFQHASFADVQNRWRQASNTTDATLTDSLFVFQKVNSSTVENSQSIWQPYETEEVSVPSEYKMNFEVEHGDQSLVARAYSRLGKDRLDAFLSTFRDAVQDIVEHPSRYVTACPPGLRSLPLESAAEEEEAITWDDPAVQRYAETVRCAMSRVVNVPIESIELSTNIFSIGLDSIAAIQVASQCRKAGFRIGVADIIAGVTLGRICRAIASINSAQEYTAPAEKVAPVLVPEEESTVLAKLNVTKDEVEAIMPALAGQDYHIASWLASGRTLYEPTWTFRATKRLDTDKLGQAWHALQERHSIMRTAFVTARPDQTMQVVLKPSKIVSSTFTIEEATGELEEIVKTAVKRISHTPSDLFTPPVRLHLVRSSSETGDDADALLITMHHTTYDAWTMSRLIADLLHTYSGKTPDSSPPQFADLVAFTQRSLAALDQRAFWRQHLDGCSPTIIPPVTGDGTDDPKDRSQTFVMASSTALSLRAAEEAAKTAGRQLHTLVLLAFARALATATASASPTFGFFQLGRAASFDGIEAVSGPTVNLLPLGVRAVRERDARELVDELLAKLAERMPFEQSRLRDVAAWVGGDDTQAQMPFNASLNLLWHDDVVGREFGGEERLLEPLLVGVPTDFSANAVIEGETAVDGLDYGWVREGQLFVDVGPDRECDGIKFGVRCDGRLMGEEGVRTFVAVFEREIGEVVRAFGASEAQD
ncbi:nonribosomal siderophore peptide synthase [Diplodia corticola]|uniref:Nonribosomal siderophore peptide synthase n=1 Tax=Diplodia corticola TaxID=236234 RepID=A0A1J9SKF7_9PEZI|nr:nonribosomal siderophore peptide synthase [Diplodia corticola]OJD40823.1 nonribosomal siderophore peptide synthase [Diplodia corticola]